MNGIAAELALANLLAEREGPPEFQRAMASMFASQRAAVESAHPRRALLCSRRAGKSQAIARWLYQGGLDDPGGLSVYVGRTKGLARMVCLSAYEEMGQQYGLPFHAREIDGQIMVELPNRHRIWLAGCKNAAEAGKFRGPKYRRFAFDEAQLPGSWLRDVIQEDIEPALLDKAGELMLAGTPGPVPEGFFFEASTGLPGWERHHWTLRDNPHLRGVDEWLSRKLSDNHWTEDHPTYQREYWGRWVLDHDALVFRWDAQRNKGDLPTDVPIRYCIGVDLGGTGTSAWSVLANPQGQPEVYCIHVEEHESQTPSAVAARTEALRQRYRGAQIVVDAGGLGGAYVLEMNERYGMGAEAAKKTDRRAAIEILRGDLASGTFRANPWQVGPLLDEWQVLQWDDRRENFDPRFPDHMTDATIYAHRRLKPIYRPEIIEDPKDPTIARLDRYRERAKVEARRRAQRKAMGKLL